MAWSEADDDRVRELCKTIDVGQLTSCPKCGMGESGLSEMMLSPFCTHKYCPFRDWKNSRDETAEKEVLAPYYKRPTNIAAFTPNEAVYPPYVSINRTGAGVEISVRSPKWHDPDVGYDKPGFVAAITLPEEDWKRLVKEINKND